MEFTPPSESLTIPWEQSRVYPDKIVSGSAEHDGAHLRLFELAQELESDFEPYGKRIRGGWDSSDCSCGCRHYAALGEVLGQDWGVCMNKRSPRAGRLTFEHQGCREFERANQDSSNHGPGDESFSAKETFG